MLGCYDFCAHYEWTFAWLEQRGGKELLHAYWAEAIGGDSQKHAAKLIRDKGLAGMAEYWGHTLSEESPEQGYAITAGSDYFRIDMHDCPSKGFLLHNGLQQYADYCDHCIGWIAPVLEQAGFVTDHEHNHRGQCWWEIRSRADKKQASALGAHSVDVRIRTDWDESGTVIDRYIRNQAKPCSHSASS